MIKYPPVQHKIPELFMLIIEMDNLIALMKYEALVVSLEEWIATKARRRELTEGAEKFIKEQKKP